MEALEGAVRFFRDTCLRDAIRRHLYLILIAITVCGSIVKEFCPLPDSYLNNKRNVLNVYFVKVAWGWTLWLLLPFIAITNFSLTRNIKEVLRRMTSLLVGTAVWYTCTQFFLCNCLALTALDLFIGLLPLMSLEPETAGKDKSREGEGVDISADEVIAGIRTM
ncbi:hypothetical protein NDU88_001915 [Pleurodeles waltl]|uniref:Uncharacterized protein n=1 Tax=Pleurodeles waltl TaxID=8319 RepID=A0AAV7P797_PLEWA|nr:hypothetical protein NDU88_001915 [Pleurodeles waltl]